VEGTIERLCAVNDREVFAELVRPHWGVMTTLARRLAPSGDGDDVLQEALSAAWRKRGQFDPTRGTARNWLLAIVADQALKGRRRLRPTSELVDLADDERDTAVDVDLRAALDRLTPRQRSTVALHYYLGMPVADVASVLGCSAGTVKSTLSDARARLRSILGEDYR
jgi:RNA polymerase sigma-70 factor (ECF subfamily)